MRVPFFSLKSLMSSVVSFLREENDRQNNLLFKTKFVLSREAFFIHFEKLEQKFENFIYFHRFNFSIPEHHWTIVHLTKVINTFSKRIFTQIRQTNINLQYFMHKIPFLSTNVYEIIIVKEQEGHGSSFIYTFFKYRNRLLSRPWS